VKCGLQRSQAVVLKHVQQSLCIRMTHCTYRLARVVKTKEKNLGIFVRQTLNLSSKCIQKHDDMSVHCPERAARIHTQLSKNVLQCVSPKVLDTFEEKYMVYYHRLLESLRTQNQLIMNMTVLVDHKR